MTEGGKEPPPWKASLVAGQAEGYAGFLGEGDRVGDHFENSRLLPVFCYWVGRAEGH